MRKIKEIIETTTIEDEKIHKNVRVFEHTIRSWEELTREEKIQLIQKNIGWESRTTNYLFNDYKYGEEALEKLFDFIGG